MSMGHFGGCHAGNSFGSRSLPRSLGSQLCDCLRSRILSGALEGGTRLPSTRELARELGSRGPSCSRPSSSSRPRATSRGGGARAASFARAPRLPRRPPRHRSAAQAAAPCPKRRHGDQRAPVDFRPGCPPSTLPARGLGAGPRRGRPSPAARGAWATARARGSRPARGDGRLPLPLQGVRASAGGIYHHFGLLPGPRPGLAGPPLRLARRTGGRCWRTPASPR